MFIRTSAAISPQPTFGNLTPNAPVEYVGDKLSCIEPNYNTLLDPKLIRRMSRIIKMGSASALNALQEANLENPDAIIVGTAYGCMEDTEIFLRKMIQNQEELLTPTAFIQSTHNTVGAQIALICKCHQYNNTFVQNGFSFETALLDGILMLRDGEAKQLLVGGVDEIIPASHAILHRFGLYKS
ncbi:MAG: beta-ketoacyl synthase, partial [Bacteroidetes bacterium]